ncbi:hypothetical protein CLN94_06570 [Pseudothioclava arenosa]|uniref:Uncharacterized protein n=2 Tax=Pseudothioclava arenosa TaxID=1795308 RepID=A0A2A4CQ85_9RHOB|nr:hypothetical protein CLN94_06570 [Pseudothioclava arenosa]
MTGRERKLTVIAATDADAREEAVAQLQIDFGSIKSVEPKPTVGQFPHWMDKTEARIANKLLTAILSDKELFVRVYDGEDWVTEWTRDRAAIQRETAQTEVTRYYIARQPEGGGAQRVGSFLLIHGNGEDVLSDGSWNPRCDGAEAFIDGMWKRLGLI